MCWLMFMGRGVTQAVRVVLGALMPFIAVDLDLDHQEKGTVASRLRCGLHVHAGAGGWAARPVRRAGSYFLALGSLGMGATCIPWSADLFGANGLSACLFVMGLCEGPSIRRWAHCWDDGSPRTNEARSRSPTLDLHRFDAHLRVAPPLATLYGWRTTMRLWAYACLLSTAGGVYATNGPDECIRALSEN